MCQCLPDKIFQLSHFATQIPSTAKADVRENVSTIFAQLLRQSIRSALLIENVDTGAKLLFQLFSATDGQTQANTRGVIRGRLRQFASSNINAHVVMQSKEFGPAGIDPELGVSPNGKPDQPSNGILKRTRASDPTRLFPARPRSAPGRSLN